jgi:histidine triad (HIT) family protein
MYDCIFCRIVARKMPGYVVDETATLIVFIALENHPLIVPKVHVPDIFDLTDELAADIARSTIRVAKATKIAASADGIYITQANGAAAGQDVFHYHMHIYPKWLDGRKPQATPTARMELAEKIRSKL